MTIELIDERTDKDETYQYEKGLEEFIDWINNDKEAYFHAVASVCVS